MGKVVLKLRYVYIIMCSSIAKLSESCGMYIPSRVYQLTKPFQSCGMHISYIMIISPRPLLFLSDHCFAECTLAIPSDATTARELTFRKYKNIDITAFPKDIAKSDLTRLKDNELAEGYDRILNSILDAHAPLRRKVIVTRPRVPWFNDELRSLKSKRRKLEKRMRKATLILTSGLIV